MIAYIQQKDQTLERMRYVKELAGGHKIFIDLMESHVTPRKLANARRHTRLSSADGLVGHLRLLGPTFSCQKQLKTAISFIYPSNVAAPQKFCYF